jgi:site-specific DNA recombinase
MIAAIYARKSTDQSAVADEAKSVRRQIDHARTYAARKGWTVDEAHVYVDDGISGAEFANRPGFVWLMNSLKPRPPFQVLIMSEESRLGREAIETAYALKQIIAAGVRVFFYLEDRERTLDSAIEKVMLSIQTMADEMEREKARQRMVDTMTRKARLGHVPGGACFGYDNVRVDGHVEYRINERQATIVRRIFELAAAGHGMSAIAKMLNADGAPAPRSQRGRPRAWIQSSIHAVLHRRKYVGEIVWNQTQKRDRWGQRHQTDRDRSEWITVAAAELRIVSEDLWEAAHRQIERSRSVTNIKARAKESKYLLPGLARCAWCSGGLHVRTRTRTHAPALHFYACTSHFNRGESVCGNLVQVPMEMVDTKVLAAIGNILRPELVEHVVNGVRQHFDPDTGATRRERLMAELADAERQVANLTEAIALGGNLPALVARLQKAEQARQALILALQNVDDNAAPVIDWRDLERRTRGLLREWRNLLARNPSDARPFLRQHLTEPLIVTPILKPDRRGVVIDGALDVGEILLGNACSNKAGVPGQN